MIIGASKSYFKFSERHLLQFPRDVVTKISLRAPPPNPFASVDFQPNTQLYCMNL